MYLATSQRNLDEGSRPPFYAGRKLGDIEKGLRWIVATNLLSRVDLLLKWRRV
jgi:hypothetical protein